MFARDLERVPKIYNYARGRNDILIYWSKYTRDN